MGGPGRPEKPIDWKLVDQLLMADCTGSEIAANFDMHHQTFCDRVYKQYGINFTEYASEKKQKGDSILRAKQYEKALEKDNTMMIWLGKQRLGQRERFPDETAPTNLQDLAKLAAFFTSLSDSQKKLVLEGDKAPTEDHSESPPSPLHAEEVPPSV